MTQVPESSAAPAPVRPAETLLARLDDPQTASNLNRLLDRAGDINALLDMLENSLQRGPRLADNVGRLVRETRERVPGIEEDLPRLAQQGQRVSRALSTPQADALLSKLEDPATLQAATQLVEKLPDLLLLARMAENFMQRGPSFSNNVGRLLREFRTAQQGPGGLGQAVGNLTSLDFNAISRGVTNFISVTNSPEIRNLLNSGIFGKETVNLVSDVAEAARLAALHEANHDIVPAHRTVWGQVKAIFALLRDPAVWRTIAFVLLFAQQLGQALARRERDPAAQ